MNDGKGKGPIDVLFTIIAGVIGLVVVLGHIVVTYPWYCIGAVVGGILLYRFLK